jgi:PAS domain S-box-containing protein
METNRNLLNLTDLPAYAAFLLKDYIDDYTREAIRLSYALNVPLLKFLKHYSDEQIFQISKASNIEFLSSLSKNDIENYIDISSQKWLSNQLGVVGKLDIAAEDITLINYVRQKTLQKWTSAFTSDAGQIIKLYAEIDDLVLYYNTVSTNSYIRILKESIDEGIHFSSNIINSSPGITFIYDLEQGKEIYINGRVEELMGFTSEEVLKQPNLIATLTHPDDVEVVSGFLQGLVAEQTPKTHIAEYRFKSKEGKYYWLRCYAVVYKRNKDGAVSQILGTAFEVSKEKETADALVKRERQLLEAQAISKIGSYEWDLVADQSTHTPELMNIFQSEIGKGVDRWMEQVHPDDVESVRSAIAESFQTGTYASEFRYLAAGSEKFILSKGEVFFDKDKKPLKLIGTVQDISMQKKIEEDLLNNAMELQRSNTQLREFAFVASHDLKEPLRKIGMYSNIIMGTDWDALSEKTKVNLQKISEAAVRMQKLIEGILSYSSFDTSTAKERTNLEQVFREALNNLEFQIKETGAVITSDNLPVAEVYPFQMQQLFQNLVGNAIKFTTKDKTPQINITHSVHTADKPSDKNLQPAKAYLHINITDNGIGFSNEMAEKVFGIFQRLHSKAEYEGSGLGLAICKKIAGNHGGIITAVSQQGAGSTFTVILPML